MSIDAYNPRQEFVGDGVVDTYTFDFRIRKSSHLLIAVYDDQFEKQFEVRGDDTTYIDTLTFDPLLDGGEIVFKNPIDNLYHLFLILDNNEPIQTSEFRDKSDFTLRLFERALDWLANPMQSILYRVSRALTMSQATLDATGFNMELPPFPGPNQVPAINDDEDGWTWIDQSSFVGPKGDQGDPGPQGDPGTNGNTVLSGSGAPSNGLGVDNDFYIDTTAWMIYGPKSLGVWGAGTDMIPDGSGAVRCSVEDLAMGVDTHTVVFSTPLASAAYRPICKFANYADDIDNLVFLNDMVVDQDVNGFTVKLNAPPPTANYKILYGVFLDA